MTADELIAKCHEFALAPRKGDDDLDAMSPEEAADRGLFCAWWDQRERRKAQAMAAVMAEAHAQVAELATELIREHLSREAKS